MKCLCFFVAVLLAVVFAQASWGAVRVVDASEAAGIFASGAGCPAGTCEIIADEENPVGCEDCAWGGGCIDTCWEHLDEWCVGGSEQLDCNGESFYRLSETCNDCYEEPFQMCFDDVPVCTDGEDYNTGHSVSLCYL